MPNEILELKQSIQEQFSANHARIFELIAREDQIMSTFGVECATELPSEEVATCLGDLVRASYIRVYNKHNRRPAWETVKDVAKAS